MSYKCVLVTCVAIAGSLAAAPAQRPDRMAGDALFAAYAATGERILASAFPDNTRFEEFRKDFRDRVLAQWELAERRPLQAMFMFDVAAVAHDRHYRYWADFIALGTTFLGGRADAPGVDRAFDAFEIAWYKAALALHHGRRRPDLVAEATAALDGRLAAAPVPPPGAPALVDPWIAIARGFAEEGFTLEDPTVLERRGRSALAHYAEAATHESTRAEAVVRSARLLTRLNRPEEALALLERVDDRSTTDGVFRYWRSLFRGRALQALGRDDDAMAAFEDALRVVPSAQSPRVAMMAIELQRHREDAAEEWAAAVRTAADPVVDPWWSYPHGDRRFLQDRVQAIRAMSRR